MEKIKEYQTILSCIIISSVLLVSTVLITSKIQKNETVTVTGSASRTVKSDNAKLTFEIQSIGKNQKETYSKLKARESGIREYLISKGIENENMDFKTITGYYTYQNNDKGYPTGVILHYTANQNVEIKSKDVLKIKEIASDIGSLAGDETDINVMQPEYFYTDLASIKIDLLKEASIDAKQRAKSMLNATGSSVGKVQSMRMGVFQITPIDSTMVADFGLNDTTTIDKKVTAVANIVFKVK